MYNAPYNEINYTAECTAVITKKITFSAQPNLSEGERVEIAKEHLKDELGNSLEDVQYIEVYTS